MSNLIGKEINGTLVTKDTPNEEWKGDFNCVTCGLTSLKGCPFSVSGYFVCGGNRLTSLEGCPSIIGVDFFCDNNLLTSLEGCPSEVGGNFYCSSNKLTSLQNIHLHIKKMNGTLYCSSNPIKSHVLGVLLIEGCNDIILTNKYIQDILYKYLTGSRDIFDCQFELIEAGYGEFAQL